jgi:RNA polymerase sigma factor for flagellar operon FliA
VRVFASAKGADGISECVIGEKKSGPPPDASQREKLLLAHLPQVRCIARRIHDRLPPHVPLEDMVHEGVLGLMDAVKKYDPGRNVPLKYYADFRIRGAIVDSLRELDWGPRKLRHRGRCIEEAIAQCKMEMGRDPSEGEVAFTMDISLDELHQLRRNLRTANMESLQGEMMHPNGEEKMANSWRPHEEGPYHQTLRSEMAALLAKAISELSAQEREVVTLYNFEEFTMGAIATKLGIGESRVSQIHSAALVRLRKRLRNRIGKRKNAAYWACAGGC